MCSHAWNAGTAGGEAQHNDIKCLRREIELKKAKYNELLEETRRCGGWCRLRRDQCLGLESWSMQQWQRQWQRQGQQEAGEQEQRPQRGQPL